MSGNLPGIATETISLQVSTGVPVTIPHGLGRQIEGWLVVWQTAPVVFSVQDPAADTARELVLVPNASAIVRLVLL
jgi:hypothetical protein